MPAWLRKLVSSPKPKPSKKKATTGVVLALTAAAAIIAPWEGLRTKAYYDVVGVPTVCYGETKGVKIGDSYTPEQCMDMLMERTGEFQRELRQRCLPDNLPYKVEAAVISWAYNVGTGAACRSTLMKKLVAGDLVGACNELPRWNKAGGRVWQGLVNRRKAEQKVCLEGAA